MGWGSSWYILKCVLFMYVWTDPHMCVCVDNHSLYNSAKIHMDSIRRPDGADRQYSLAIVHNI